MSVPQVPEGRALRLGENTAGDCGLLQTGFQLRLGESLGRSTRKENGERLTPLTTTLTTVANPKLSLPGQRRNSAGLRRESCRQQVLGEDAAFPSGCPLDSSQEVCVLFLAPNEASPKTCRL